MFIKKGAIFNKPPEIFEFSKLKCHENPENKRQAMERRYDNKKEKL